MKKVLWLLACSAILMLCGVVWADDGTITPLDSELSYVGPYKYHEMKVTWVYSAGVTLATDTIEITGRIERVVTDPGTTAPTDDYDIDLLDKRGVDVMGSELDNRDTANTEQVMPKIGSGYGPVYVDDYLTVSITGNSVASATGVIYIYYYK